MTHALLIVALLGASYQKRDAAADKQELILKLSSDINKVDHTIEVTKDLVKRSPDAPYLADLYFRLAELYVERSRYLYARIMEARPEGETMLSGEQALEVQISKRLAIETYQKVLTDFPEYEHNDQIRFFKAHEYRELGEFETMLKEYKDLVAAHPKSDWSIEARLILADYHFDKGELLEADAYYQAILDLPDSHLHDMARYKQAWIRINQEKFADALNLFQKAVTSQRFDKRGAIGDAKSLNVKREALSAMVWPFSEVKKSFQASDYFRRLAESKTLYLSVMKKLANRYYVKTEYENAALLYREIVLYSSDVEENIEYVQRIYDSVQNMSAKNPKRYAHAADDVENIVKTVARYLNHWKFSDETKKQVTQNFEILARDLATKLHVDSQKRGDGQSAAIAAEAYRKYLSLFAAPKERKAIQTNRASALYQSADYLGAGRQYEDIARTLEDGPERQETIYNSILAYHKSLDEDVQYRRKNPTKPGMLDKLQLLRAREGLKQLGAYYVKRWPKSPQVANVKFNIASMYYQQGEYERSAELFKAWVEEYPTHKDIAIAGNLALDALHKVDDLEGLGKLAQAFVDNPKITDAKFKADAAALAKASRQRKVEMKVLTTSEGDFSETMLKEFEKHKGSAEGEEFLYAAFVKYKNENNVGGVFDFGARLVGAYPESKKLVDVLETMGAFAVRAADFERSSFYFEEYKRRFPQEAKANQVLASAGTIRLFLGDYEKAAEDFRLLRKDGDSAQRRSAHEKLMQIYREAADWKQLATVAQTALGDDKGWLGAVFHLGLAYLGDGKLDLAQRELSRAAKMPARSDFDKEAQGRAPFELGRLLHRQYDELQFRDAESAEQVLARKLQFLEALEGAYIAAIQSGQGDWGIAALFEAARAYNDFGTFIANAPVPGGLSAAELAQYKEALSTQGAQYVAKSKETLTACKTKSDQLKIFSAFASACLTESLAPVDRQGGRVRGRVTGDEAYNQEVAQLRGELAKKPESLELLLQLARRATAVGDYHLAKLVLSKAAEADPRSAAVQNLMGVVEWNLGDHQAAYNSLKKAQRGMPAAALNLAALLKSFGYERDAQRALNEAGDTTAVRLDDADVHPSVRTMLTPEAGGT
jgi:cellulose synthase operon protein C